MTLPERLREIGADEFLPNAYADAVFEAADEIELLQADALRYRWLRTAGAWESEIGMDILSEDPAKFDAAIDAAMAASASEAERA
jgi:hypothetical protein